MTAPRTRAAAAEVSSPGVSGWCIDGLHEVCMYLPCTCTRCPGVHHSRAGQAPRIEKIGDPMPQTAAAIDAGLAPDELVEAA